MSDRFIIKSTPSVEEDEYMHEVIDTTTDICVYTTWTFDEQPSKRLVKEIKSLNKDWAIAAPKIYN